MVAGIRRAASSLLRNARNIPGWRTGRKILVLESDDWGSIRMPSRVVYDRFAARGFNVHESQYNRFDALESNEDLELLFEVLCAHRDSHGNPATLTANVIVCNPDFNKIAESGCLEYHYEHFTRTLERYPRHDKVFTLYRQGIDERIFRPQCHGREHLNVARWMRALRRGDAKVKFSFQHGTTYSGHDDYSFMEALDTDDPSEIDSLDHILRDGLRIFDEIFGYASKSFIAPCYTWDSALEESLKHSGVRYLQGGTYQFVPRGGFENYSKRYHYLGERNSAGLVYLVRNCAFEPTLFRKDDWVGYTLGNIRDAFRWGKPAVVTTHRLNFIGFIEPANRDRNLKLLDELLGSVLKQWPDVEFMSSDQLGDEIAASY